MPLSVIILIIVLFAIALRQVLRIPLRIWHIMSLGALAVLLTQQITPLQAIKAINWNILCYLFGVFALGQALEVSGYLQQLSGRLFKHAQSINHFLFLFVFAIGISSALLMNDTLAIIGTPLCLLLARANKLSPQPLLLALAYSITVGSVMSPIGNPQNLLIAIHGGLTQPFVTFITSLALPTLLSLLMVFIYIRVKYRRDFVVNKIELGKPDPGDVHLISRVKLALTVFVLLILTKIVLVIAQEKWQLPFSVIAIAAALPVLLCKRGPGVIKSMDWSTLVFFAAMFVLMSSVWQTGLLQQLMANSHFNLTHGGTIFVLSALFSQLISNVPLVALYLPVLMHSGASQAALMALAAGSTLAGNLLVIGAASNVIIVQNAESRGYHGFRLFDLSNFLFWCLQMAVFMLFISF